MKKYISKFRVTHMYILQILILLLAIGCKKFVQVSPPSTQLISSTVFENDATANAAVAGIYSQMMQTGFGSGDNLSVTFLAGLSSDEIVPYEPTPDISQFYNNALLPANMTLNQDIWSMAYQYIYAANEVIENAQASKSLSASMKSQLSGEAYFIRAFCNFYLVNLFGRPPLVNSTDYRVNSSVPNAAYDSIYSQIIIDLKIAKSFLLLDYSFSSGEKVRPNKYAAEALLARVYLFYNDWADAKSEADSVINSGQYSLCPGLNDVFLKNSSEAIFQLMPVLPGKNTNEGATFILTDNPTNGYLSSSLLNAFEPGDLRRIDWVDSIIYNGNAYYFPYKYKVQFSSNLTEYSMVLRLAEIYLIRAEAETNLSDISLAASDINIVRERAGLNDTSAETTANMISLIQHERQVELFTEWGNRWLDLKRTNTAGLILEPIKSNWVGTDTLYPIPQMQLQDDPNVTQNPGY